MPTPKYDAESLCADVGAILAAKLNTKLTAISTEKGDAIVLRPVDANAIVFQSLNDKVLNYDPFVIYGLIDPTTIAAGPDVAEVHTIQVALCFIDSGQDQTIGNKSLRYLRALREIFTDSWVENRNRVKFQVKSMAPIPAKQRNSDKLYKCVGIEIEAVIP